MTGRCSWETSEQTEKPCVWNKTSVRREDRADMGQACWTPTKCGNTLTSGQDDTSKRVLVNETNCDISAVGRVSSYLVVARTGATRNEYAGVFAPVSKAGKKTTEGVQESCEAASEGAKDGSQGAAESDCQAA